MVDRKKRHFAKKENKDCESYRFLQILIMFPDQKVLEPRGWSRRLAKNKMQQVM